MLDVAGVTLCTMPADGVGSEEEAAGTKEAVMEPAGREEAARMVVPLDGE